MLPHARPGAIAGLLELLNDRGGKEDLYRVAEDLLMEVDDLLPIVEASALLGFANSERAISSSRPKARRSPRPHLARSAVPRGRVAACFLLQQMNMALAIKSDHSMPLEFYRDVLDEHFSAEEVKQQIETALHWGRYADIFTYDSENDRLLLHENGVSEQTQASAADGGPGQYSTRTPPGESLPPDLRCCAICPSCWRARALLRPPVLRHYWIGPVNTQADISLTPGVLPKYALFSVARIPTAYLSAWSSRSSTATSRRTTGAPSAF